MIKIIFSVGLVFLSLCSFSQTYNSPESVEFDYANNRWLIANNSGNNILSRSSSTGAVTLFAACSGGPHGIEIVNDTLYVCAAGSLKAFNINSATPIFTINLGATFLNGITHDNNGFLYITDFSAYKIYRFNISTRAFSVFVPSTGTAKPNGIIFDQPNNRCVFVNWGASAPINAMDINTGVVTTIITSTLGNCDGIAKDGAGNYYISSWTGNKITRFTNTFTTPTTVVTGLTNPADIFYNILTDTLGNPNSGTLNNTTYHYFGNATGIKETAESMSQLTVYPNPVRATTAISYELINNSKVLIQLFDLKGSLIKTILDEKQNEGKQTVFLNSSGLSAGAYTLTVKTDLYVETKKIIITR